MGNLGLRIFGKKPPKGLCNKTDCSSSLPDCGKGDQGGKNGKDKSGNIGKTRCKNVAGNCFGAGTLVHTTDGTQAIETLCIGQRVKTYLPEERREEMPYEPSHLEWAAHRVVTLTLPCLNDESIELQLLRDPDWFRLHQPEVGETLWLDMPEMGVEGEALVEAINGCPEIETGPGRVITATFAHSTGDCMEFDIEGESTPLRVTGGHPIWREAVAEQGFKEEWDQYCHIINGAVSDSCDCDAPSIYSLPDEVEKEQAAFATLASTVIDCTRKLLAPEEQAWIPAEELEMGDCLKSLNGLRQITNRHLERTTERVYNIEVDGDHVYRVGESGLLVHNASALPGRQVSYGSTDLSQLAQAIRKSKDNYSQRNLAIFEYRDGNTLKTVCAFSRGNLQFVRDLGHSERRIARWLKRNNISFCDVTRIYSELSPCTVIGCDRFVAENFPNATVTWSFEYGDREALENARGGGDEDMEEARELDQESRDKGSAEFAKALSALQTVEIAGNNKRCV
ncbi:MAG: hypothetical protein CME32_20455 [Gimesia sp.]|nr:hypothetical protein [Gimesia sp.]